MMMPGRRKGGPRYKNKTENKLRRSQLPRSAVLMDEYSSDVHY